MSKETLFDCRKCKYCIIYDYWSYGFTSKSGKLIENQEVCEKGVPIRNICLRKCSHFHKRMGTKSRKVGR